MKTVRLIVIRAACRGRMNIKHILRLVGVIFLLIFIYWYSESGLRQEDGLARDEIPFHIQNNYHRTEYGRASASIDRTEDIDLSDMENAGRATLIKFTESLKNLFEQWAICRVEPEISELNGSLLYPSSDNMLPAPILDGDLLMTGWRDGKGYLLIPGYESVEISWSGVTDRNTGECSPDPIVLVPGGTIVQGRVVDEAGDPWSHVFVSGCGATGTTDDSGQFYMEILPQPCQLIPMESFSLSDGEYQSFGPSKLLDPVPNQEIYLDFMLPRYTQGILGLALKKTRDGLLVTSVIADTPAKKSGFVEGETIVEIDHESVPRYYLNKIMGPEGTDVNLTVLTIQGNREPRTLIRTWY